MQNPLLKAYKKAIREHPTFGPAVFEARRALVKKYAWAVPDDEALALLCEHGPLVEAGAGTGYWASLLRLKGADVVAYDRSPPRGSVSLNKWHDPCQYTEVHRGGSEVLWAHGDRTLFLCWPPYDDPFALDCLKNYAGGKLVYVGEDEGGCTANEQFFMELDEYWQQEECLLVPRWPGLHDYMFVYVRRP